MYMRSIVDVVYANTRVSVESRGSADPTFKCVSNFTYIYIYMYTYMYI